MENTYLYYCVKRLMAGLSGAWLLYKHVTMLMRTEEHSIAVCFSSAYDGVAAQLMI